MKEAVTNEYFRQERRDVEAVIPKDAMRILDVGCGEGILGRRLLDSGVSEVVGVEFSPEACEKAKDNLTSVICGDIEEIDLPFDEQYFDCMIFADILEHLKDPLLALRRLAEKLSDSGVVVASIPNVRYYGIINMLAQGSWKYADFGILDRTHLRFFTKNEIETLFTDAGFEITGMTDNIDPAYNRLNDPFSGEITFGRVTLSGLTPDEIRDLFVVQYIIRAQKTGYELNKINMAVNTAIKCENLEEARQTIENYLELHPVDMDMLYKHAEICFKLGFNEEALESLQKILIFYPDKEEAVNLRDTINRIETKDGNKNDPQQIQNTVFSEKKNEKVRKKVAVVRGANLNKWEMQNYEPLLDSYDITAYTTSETYFDVRDIKLPVARLPFHSQGLLMEMQGLNDHLADKDIVFSADITYKFSAQAVRAKQQFGNKLICLEWENIPFNYEEYDVVREIKELVRNGADHFIAVTERAKEALVLEGVPEGKIDVIPMGVDLSIFKPRGNDILKDRSELGINSDETVVLFIGRMVW
ncbi:MAG: methyltransferase domain-containing protein, partial [Nitrospirae bacterium]|nr:methyltransferase domain-containing protein [Nitrospirota bacterium]